MGWIALGMKLLPYIVESVQWVERFVTTKGRQKQDAAIFLVRSLLGVVEQGKGKDLLDDDEVEASARAVIDAVVSLNNLIAKKNSSE
jgi:hypothetical protein